jgi:hypothetical protein
MNCSIYMGLDYTNDDLFNGRLELFRSHTLLSIMLQTNKSFTLQVLCRDRHTPRLAEVLGGSGVKHIIHPVPGDWEGYSHRVYNSLKLFNYKYDIQVRFDSDDYIAPEFISTAYYIAGKERGGDVLVSYQWRAYDWSTGRVYSTGKKWNRRCSAFAVLIRPMRFNVFTDKHSRLQSKARKFIYVPSDRYCMATVHDNNQERSKTRIHEWDKLSIPGYKKIK